MKRKVGSFNKKRVVVFINKKSPLVRFEVSNSAIVLKMPDGINYRQLLKKHISWIEERIRLFQEASLIAKDLRIYAKSEKQFKKFVQEYSKKTAKKLGVPLKVVRVRYMKTKWGSWSTNSVLTVNAFLRFLPKDLVKYVIFHELVHYFEPYHTENFYRIMREYFGDIEKLDLKISAYWGCLQSKGIVKLYV